MGNYIPPFISNKMLEYVASIMEKVGKMDNIDPAIENGLIKMTLPDKPTSKNQMYYKT